MGKDFLGNLSMREMLVMTSAYVCQPARTEYQGEGGEAGSVWGWECVSNFPWREIAEQR